MLSLVAVNAVFLIPAAGLFALLLTALMTLTPFMSSAWILFFVFLFAYSFIASLQAFAFAPFAAKAADFRGWSIKECLKNTASSLKDAALFALIITGIAMVMCVCVPFYFKQKSVLFAAVGVLFVWLCLFALLSLQWFVAITALLPSPFTKRIKKCFLLFFDNTAFSIFLALYSLLLVFLSVVFFGLLPAISGITLAQVNALRLRLYKYDYLDCHPEYAARKERKIIPWQDLLQADKEALGSRTIKSFIFPWKE